MDRQKVCCFTGHRAIASADLTQLTKRLDKTIVELIQKGVVFFGTGGACGFDVLAAKAVLRQKEKNKAVKLIMVLPCRDQDARWNDEEKREYRWVLDAADKVVCLSERYYDGCMAQRNLHLVEHSGVCVAYMKHGRSGTSQTVRLAHERGLTVINLAKD